MIEYVYPAVLFNDDENEKVVLLFPDFNLTLVGDDFEDAFLIGQGYLRYYIESALKHELDFEKPSKFEAVSKKFSGKQIVFIDALVDEEKIRKSL